MMRKKTGQESTAVGLSEGKTKHSEKYFNMSLQGKKARVWGCLKGKQRIVTKKNMVKKVSRARKYGCRAV